MAHPEHGKSLEQLVEQQITRWDLASHRRTQVERPGRGKVGRIYFGPYLLISRDRGAGGRQVANLIGRKLGWQVFDRQIVDAIAQRTRMRQQLVENLDEKTRGGLEEFLRNVLIGEIGTTDYMLHLRQVLVTLGQQGDVVILGRGAEHILPGRFGLCVRLVAPLDVRTERIARASGLAPEAAHTLVAKADEERKHYVHDHFRKDLFDALNYDLVINTGALTVEGTAEIVLAALKQKLGVVQTSAVAA